MLLGDTYRPYGTKDIWTSHIYKHIVPTGLEALLQRIYLKLTPMVQLGNRTYRSGV